MSCKKPVYLLSGRSPRREGLADPVIQAVFRESETAAPTIAYTGTANGDNSDFFNRMAAAFIKEGAYRVNHALLSPDGADIKAAQAVLQSADIIFFSGGDVDQGIRVLMENNMVDFLLGLYEQGKPFFGSSAGAIMLAKEWVRWRDPDDNSSAELFPCLGLAPVICDTHDEDSGWQELKKALRLEEDNTRGYGIVTGTAIRVLPTGEVEAWSGAVHQYIRHGEGVERIADILPIRDRR